jgi:hypothetical protein
MRLAIGLAAHLFLLVACFGLAWRPVLGGACALGIVGALTLSSRIKHRIMRENVVFSDLLLVRTIVRHPRLYYLSFSDVRLQLGALGIVAVAALWLWLEPSLLPAGPWAVLLAPLPLAAGLLGLWATARLGGEPVARAALPRENPTAAIDAAIDAVGLLASLLVLWGEWTRMVRPPGGPCTPSWRGGLRLPSWPPPCRDRKGSAAPATRGPPLIVAIQCESFLNPRGRGLAAPRLEAFERASAQALHSGRLGVPGLRGQHHAGGVRLPERAAQRLARLRPVQSLPHGAGLRRRGLARPPVPAGVADAVRAPLRPRFFERDRVVPALGFERAIWQEDFGSAARRGHYIADLAVARRILQEADAATEPTFVFAVTMENHGPWGDGRLPGIDAPLDQYLHHLEGADAMVAALMEGLRHRAGPTLLCLYGDHVPALRGLGPEAEAGLTDFVIVDPSARTPAAGGREPRRVEELLALCVAAVQP